MIKFDNNLVDNEDGKNFIVRSIEYFVNNSRNILKDSPFKTLNEPKSIKLYEEYLTALKVVKENNINIEKICNLLLDKACSYLNYTENGLTYENSQPYKGLSLFNLIYWYENLSPENYTLKEQFILIINKVSKTFFYDLKF